MAGIFVAVVSGNSRSTPTLAVCPRQMLVTGILSRCSAWLAAAASIDSANRAYHATKRRRFTVHLCTGFASVFHHVARPDRCLRQHALVAELARERFLAILQP